MHQPLAKFFVISIDTEADCSRDWTGRSPESYTNINALESLLLPLLARHGALATLLLNNDVTEREAPSAICERLNHEAKWELGTHLHGEFVEPDRKHSSPAAVKLRDFQCGYQPDIERAKLATLTQTFINRFSFRPTSFRAGRLEPAPTLGNH